MVMPFVFSLLFLLVNSVWLFLVVVGLPGNWLIVATTAGVAWWKWDPEHQLISPWTLVALVAVAAMGEVLEFVAGAAGAKQAGGSTRGAAGALGGGLVGALVGTFLIPIPLIGSLMGAAGGAALGAWAMEMSGGKEMEASVRIGVSAGIGRLVGTLLKLSVGVVLWVIAAAALFWR